ncbi:hypothetical protein I0D00_06295 [Pseudomonas lalucatii]|uniref:Lipoprotein n=1 Tax=Pseudomonas lalucatii TaxID=1424203 RepID=A0ABS5PYH7_9PSED|nr:hypothetical protein [Pseudomonas lalucatii]MBS7661562.1 hypothetical protein [Pseudomonas lalucatii]MBS7691883.1 hypothetical protein [Pseudomonas lalucatii]MBS7724000.1 hypothetical protein [Pseudomonas lalucatii]QVM87997.1 hypothetical protein I0D68_03395 [Pseudomonas lalucatii]
MHYKSLLVALFGLSLTGCAVYGGGYDHGYRGYERHYSSNYHQVQRYPVYVVPRYHGHDLRRHDGRHFTPRRHDQRRYLPAPDARHYGVDRRSVHRLEGRRDYRSAEPRPGWRGQHFKPDERTPKLRHRHRGAGGDGYRGRQRRQY